MIAVCAVAAYLLGSVPASYLAGKWARGIDLRRHGSGNLGATNTFRVLGLGVAAPVIVFDILKGAVPVWLFPRWDGTPNWRWGLLYGGCAFLGHVFSVFVRFRGGKGVATGAGVFLGLAPLAAAVGVLTWLLAVALTRIVSLSSLVAALVLLGTLGLTDHRPEVVALGVATVSLVVFAHRGNIARLRRGEEPRFGEGGGEGQS